MTELEYVPSELSEYPPPGKATMPYLAMMYKATRKSRRCGSEDTPVDPSTGKKVTIRGIEFDRSEVLEALAESGSPDQDQKGTGPE